MLCAKLTHQSSRSLVTNQSLASNFVQAVFNSSTVLSTDGRRWLVVQGAPQVPPSHCCLPADAYTTRAGSFNWDAPTFNLACPQGAFISQLQGRSGDWVDSVGATCSNGQSLGLVGLSTGGVTWSLTNTTGFSQIRVTFGDYYMAGVSAANSTYGTMDGTATTLQCPAGMSVVGLYGQAIPNRPYVLNLGLVCRVAGEPRSVLAPACDAHVHYSVR